MRPQSGQTGPNLAGARPTRTELGAVLGVSSRWIGELRATGNLPADGATLKENIAAFIAYRLKGHSNAR